MSDIQHIDIDDDAFEDAPRALREYAKQLKKAFEEKAREADTLRGTLQSQALSGVLADKGFKNPKRVERDLLADNIDPLDIEAVNAWLSDNGDDYAKGTGSAESVTRTSDTDPEAAERQRLRTVVDEASASEASNRFEQAIAEITPDMDGEAVKAVYAKYGI